MADVVCLRRSPDRLRADRDRPRSRRRPAFEKAPGGAPANVAVGLVRLGVPSAFMGMVGDDGSAASWPTRSREPASTSRPLRFEPRGAHRARLRLPARGRRARVPVLPPPQRRHAVHARRGRRGRDRAPRGSSTSARSAWSPSQPRATALHAVALARRARQADLLRRQPAPRPLADAEAARDGHPPGPRRGAHRQAQRRRARISSPAAATRASGRAALASTASARWR